MKTQVLVIAFAMLGFSGCAARPQDQLIGKWETGVDPVKMTIEFANDGKANIGLLGQTVAGTYKVIRDDELEWTYSGKTVKGKFKVTATELEFTSDGKTVKYKRV